MSESPRSRAYGYAAYGGPEVEQWFERPVPDPGPGEVSIDVHAVGVNPVDHKLRSGAFARPDAHPRFPLVLGVDAAGTVRACGTDVEGFAVGERVVGKAAAGHGAYAEQTVLRVSDTVAVPSGLAAVDAATLPVAGATAWEALERLRVGSGETLLLNGAGGGVGIFTAQLARDRGVRVLAVAGSAKRELLDGVRACPIAYDAEDVLARAREVAPDGVDAILDLVGGSALREVAILAVDPGRIISVADPAVTELGGSMFSAGTTGLARLVELMAAGRLDPHRQVFPFAEAAAALRTVESGHARGKVVLDLS